MLFWAHIGLAGTFGWWLWRAGCNSQDTFLLYHYINRIKCTKWISPVFVNKPGIEIKITKQKTYLLIPFKMSSFAQNVDKALEIFWNDWMDLVLHNLTVAVVKLRRPPDHAVGLPVPDALDQLVLQVLLPGKGLAWTGVRDCVTKLPLLVRPGHIHSHQRGRDSQTTASCCKNRKVSSKMFN